MTEVASWRQCYFDLVEELFRREGLTPLAPVAYPDQPLMVRLSIDGVSFDLTHLELERSDTVLVVCRYGALPAANEVEVMLRLLELNACDGGQQGSLFSLDPDGGDVLMTWPQSLHEIDGHAVFDSMRQAAASARQWRATHFIDAPVLATDPVYAFSMA